MKLQPSSSLEICVLAGGLSQRMGRVKSRLKLGRRTMLGQIRATAKFLDVPVRVIRRDVIARCGPLGGIYTALKSTRADAVLFLACDMPFVTEKLLRATRKRFGRHNQALFVQSAGGTGFPFMLRRNSLEIVTVQIERKKFSLHALAGALKAKIWPLPMSWHSQLQNVNTPAEWASARHSWLHSHERRP